MSNAHDFQLAPSLARLIEKERGGYHIRQGYFPDRPDQDIYVQVEGEAGRLVLVTNHPTGRVEEATNISRAQAEALLELTAGRVEYLSISLNIGLQTVTLRRFLKPGPLDLITVTAEPSKPTHMFQPLAWFGPEITGDSAYQARYIALAGLPSAQEIEITDAALNGLLDTLSSHLEVFQSQEAAPQLVASSNSAETQFGEDEQDQDALVIRDSIIRDLARSLNLPPS
ncbi:CYTH domain-containing protein [Microvirga lotononidis]|uniref:CYTH domain-containing protein n=1 Tax=Microvirga lotononidis TaxID=864069 RepID=I4Z408_9HYPH|nr:hypothetical protein [Microvirga lotononidis]EIM30950.1 hypothetical protein MicloDRAFT_00004790 [Microvirga lotononidis]WQO30288.1 hypothetical protein U0023_28795 [Microvirga lotononidis]